MIEVSHLSKAYGTRQALADVSFALEKGKVYGFLGVNGAGKSTTMNIMTGCLAPTSGTVTVNGISMAEEPEKAKRFIGYLPELPPVYPDMTVEEYLFFVAELKGIPKGMRKAEVKRVAEETHLTDVRERLIRNLSKGYQQRTGLAQAILNDPEIMILDEPTVGMDPQQILEVRRLIAGLRAEHIVILSSHILSEISAVCDEILILANGRLVARGSEEALTAGDSTGELHITLRAEDGMTEEKIGRLLAEAGLAVTDMHRKKETLEEVFLRVTGGTQSGGEETAV